MRRPPPRRTGRESFPSSGSSRGKIVFRDRIPQSTRTHWSVAAKATRWPWSSPAAANPHMDAVAINIPVWHPHGAMPGWVRPITMTPNPMPTPDPCASNPYKTRAGSDGDRFHDGLGRRLGHDYFLAGDDGTRRRLPVNHALAIDATSSQEGHGGNHQSCFQQKQCLHTALDKQL